MAITAIAIATALCGCPNNAGNLICERLIFDPATGQVYETQIIPFNDYNDGPFGVYLRFTGEAKGDTIKSGSVTYTLTSGKDETIPLTITDGEKSLEGEKCMGCVPAVLAGAAPIAGFVIPVIINFSDDKEPPVSDVIVQVGANTKEYTVRVKLESGAEWFTTFSGPANGYQPPAEDNYRLTVKVQGEGSVAIDGVDDEVTTSAVFDVDAGSEVYFTAQPDSGWRFEKWLVNGATGTNNPQAMVTMESDVDLIAVFVEVSAPVDTTAPTITVLGENPVNLTVGATWTDPGATAIDAVDGVCNVSVSGTVNTGVAGTYTLTYSAADRSGNQATATRTVVVSANPPNPSTPIVGTLSWNGSQLTASFTGVTSSVFGFEIYQLAGSAPWVEREVFTTDANHNAAGRVAKFRYSLNKTLRFENVTTAAGDGYVDPAKVSWSGSLIPTRVADANGNVAWQVTVP